MLTQTKAIILTRKIYHENQLIVVAYTLQYGRVTYMLYGAHSKRSNHMAATQPLQIVDIVADHRPNRDMQVLRSIASAQPLPGIVANPLKNTTALFLAEFLSHALRTNQEDASLFFFLQGSIEWLNLAPRESVANFHIAFMVRLSVFLGFMPNMGPTNEPHGAFFDLRQSEYVSHGARSGEVLPPGEQHFLRQLLRINYRNMHLFHFTRSERATLIGNIIKYYTHHIQGFGELKTLDVLHAMFNF